MVRSVPGSLNTSSVGVQPACGSDDSPWRLTKRLITTITTTAMPRRAMRITASIADQTGYLRPSAARPDDHRGAVGDDLGQRLADLRGVEPHGDDGIGPLDPGVLDHPVEGLGAAVLDQLGVLLHLAAGEGIVVHF